MKMVILIFSHCSILLDYNFNKLEDIWFTSASHLTLATIELLMDRLPEFLSIGEFTFVCVYVRNHPFSLLKINLYNSTKDDNLESAFQIFTFHLFSLFLFAFNCMQGNCRAGI
jgi:ABC-type microcin C transport system permease subunit YejB